MAPNATYEELEQKVEALEKQVTAFQQKEPAAEESKKRYRALLDVVPYPVATFTLNGKASYLNPAFTEVFGWTLEEMRAGKANFVPRQPAPETSEKLRQLFKERAVTRYVTKRMSKEGRMIDVIAREAVFSESEMGVAGELVIFRDITKEKRTAEINEAMLRISMALPQYPELEDLLDYISTEIKRLLETQGALVILLDEEKDEFFFPGAAYEDRATTKKVKEIRLPVDALASGKVVKTGTPLIDNDAGKESDLYLERDREFGFSFDNYALVPVNSSERIIGVLAAFNKRQGIFEASDAALLEMIAGTVGLSIENARFSDALKKSHQELASLDRAKSKAMNHLSHELKTPVAIFSGTLNILEKKLERLPRKTWKRSVERAQRNVERIKHLQDEINDIIQEKGSQSKKILSFLVEQCADLLEDTMENESVAGNTINRVRSRINRIFETGPVEPEEIDISRFVGDCLDRLMPKFAHRNLKIIRKMDPVPPVWIPAMPLRKVVDGLIKNAVENTPDYGTVHVLVLKGESGVRLVVKDHGIGIIKDHRRRIFEGFFATQETADYSSGQSFDFNAGGRGADLLRMKIFSEKYHFDIDVISQRCRFIPAKNDICPGNIDACAFCKDHEDCFLSGGSEFTVDFELK